MKICVVCSSGGHLTQALLIREAFNGHEFFVCTYHGPQKDQVLKVTKGYFFENIGTSCWRMFKAIFWAFSVIRRERPDIILSFGSEIALPFFFLGKFLGLKTIYIESWSRIENLSQTGRILYYIADEFWVQWPQLLKVCGPKVKYFGGVIDICYSGDPLL